ncbi:MAG: phosphatase PAP2 family protein [Halodesulfurarchaeum sp.]
MRDLGVTSAAVTVVPEPLVLLLSVLTFLGSPTALSFLTPIGTYLGYRSGVLERREAWRLLAVVALAIGIASFLKSLLALPRPPSSLWRIEEAGFGFPSGHALVTTATTVAFARFFRPTTGKRGYVLAGGCTVVIAATRVLLGVHYLVDVLAGMAIGLAVVWIGIRASDRSLATSFAIALVSGLFGLLLPV